MKPSELVIVIAAFVIPVILIVLLLLPGVTGPLLAYASTKTGSWVIFGGLAACVFAVLLWRLYKRITRKR
jgi:hypothetical protein